MINIKTCIITGCAGFIGSHLAEECLLRGIYVYGIDKLAPFCSNPQLMKYLEEKYPQQFKFEHVDVNDIQRIPDVDVIFNICAESHVDNSIENCNEFLRSNINGVHNLLEIIRHKKIRPLFYQMSTDEIYGDVTGEQSHVETDNYNPSNPYSFSKASADLLVKSFARTYGIKYKIGRATNTWGMRQNTEKLIPKTCKNLLLNKKIPLHNYGLPVRTWLHINDCVDAILTIVSIGKENEIYNIAGNYEIENWKVVAKIANLLNANPQKPTEFIYNDDGNFSFSSGELSNTAVNIKHENGWFVYGGGMVSNMGQICDFDYHRDGQDVKYSLNGNKLKLDTRWEPKCEFDKQLPSIVEYYKNNFIW
jgi:dTDP-glucose 4,6-dehydratase